MLGPNSRSPTRLKVDPQPPWIVDPQHIQCNPGGSPSFFGGRRSSTPSLSNKNPPLHSIPNGPKRRPQRSGPAQRTPRRRATARQLRSLRPRCALEHLGEDRRGRSQSHPMRREAWVGERRMRRVLGAPGVGYGERVSFCRRRRRSECDC